MSDDNEEMQIEGAQVPVQENAQDTSNWDDRVAVDGNGDEYIRDYGKELEAR
jgi:hypothetical protein